MVETQLIEHRLLDDHAFALLDRPHARGDNWRGLPGVSLAPNEMAKDADDLPRLVAVGQLKSAQRDWLLDKLLASAPETPRPVAALLMAEVSLERLAKHLRACLIVQLLPNGKQLFRYYDPRVFRHLLWMASPLQLATLFGPTMAWTWCDARGQWRRSFPPASAVPAPSFVAHGLDLLRIGVLERCLQTLRRTVDGFVDDAENGSARRVNALLDAAIAQGLSDEADLRLYVTQAIRFNPNIHRHPELARRLRAAGDDDSYVGACADLDTETLNRYARELGDPLKEHTA